MFDLVYAPHARQSRLPSFHRLVLALLIGLLGAMPRSVAAQDAGFQTDKPYYRVGEVVRVEYRVPPIDTDDDPSAVSALFVDQWFEHTVIDLSPTGTGIIEIPNITDREGAARLSLNHSELENHPFVWIWVYPDIDPLPGALTVAGGNTVQMGAEFLVSVARPDIADAAPLDLKIELVRPAYVVDGGAINPERGMGAVNLMATASSVTLTAPTLPGQYELRLFDTTTRSYLDCLLLDVAFPNTDSVRVELLEETVLPGNDTVFFRTEGLGPFNATVRDTNERRQFTSNGLNQIMMPRSPGSYQMIVASTLGEDPMVVVVPFDVEAFDSNVRPFPTQLLKILNTEPIEAGDVITVELATQQMFATVRDDLSHLMNADGSTSVALYRLLDKKWDGTDWSDARTVHQNVRPGDRVTFTAPAPGEYVIEFGVMKPNGWVGGFNVGTADGFTCGFTEGSGSIVFDKATYQIGEEIGMTLDSAQPLFEDHDGVWTPVLMPSGDWIQTDRPEWTRRSFKLPFEGGTYQVRWYDYGTLITSDEIHIPVEDAPGSLSVREDSWNDLTRRPITVDITLDDRPLFRDPRTSMYVALLKRGQMSPTGTWRAPELVYRLPVLKSGTLEFNPQPPGQYELRLYAGHLGQYLVARVPFDSVHFEGDMPTPGGPNATEPTDLPADASEQNSSLTAGMRIANVHCATYSPPVMGNSGHLPDSIDDDLAVTDADEEDSPDPDPKYPNYTLYNSPSIPRVELWGTGLPGPETNDWSHLIPKDVIDEHHLNGRWIVMAVHGEYLFEHEVDNPDLTWAPADKHLHYKLLHKGRYSADTVDGVASPEWHGFWRTLHERAESPVTNVPGLHLERSDVYVLSVRLDAGTWAGQYTFQLGDTRVEWTLPNSTNIANTHFVRPLGIGEIVPDWLGAVRVEPGPDGQNILYERVDALFQFDQFYVEIETEQEVLTSDQISFDLYVTGGDGRPTPLDFQAHPLTAVRVGGNRRLFRSPLIRLNDEAARAGSSLFNGRREYWVPIAAGDRLAARIIPHEVARQGRLAVTQMFTTPAQVSAFWRGAVADAARIADVDIPRPLTLMSDSAIHDDVLSKPWETVDSTPFVQVGGREIQLTVGHLASMLLIRQQFITSMEEALPRLQRMRAQLNQQRAWRHTVWTLLKADALTPGSPIGAAGVLDWDPRHQTTVLGTSVPFRRAYEEAWLDTKFRGFESHRMRWQYDSASLVFQRYVAAAEQALEYARTMDVNDPDAKDLLKLTCIGMRRMVSRVHPNMLRLVEDPALLARVGIGFRWEYDRHAQHSMGLLGAIGDEFIVNEAHVDAVNAYTAIAVAVIGLFLPETYVGQAIAGGLEAGSVLMTITREIPEFLGREADVQFAIGAYLVVGEERYITADLRRKPGWQMALELVGGGFDIVASVGHLRHARNAWVALRSDTELVEAFAHGAEEFIALAPETQKAALVRLAQVSELKEAGKSLTGLETTIFEGGHKTLIELETLPDMWQFRNLKTESLTELDVVLGRNGRMAVAVPDGVPPPKGLEPSPPMKPAAANAVEEVPYRIPEDTPWHSFDVGERVGKGAYAQVFEIWHGDDARQALKVYAPGQNGIEDVQRALRAEALLREAGIPQLKIIDHGIHDGMAYIVQEFLPSPGVFNGKTGGMMSTDMQHALLELHVKLAKANIGFSDGWWANVYFFRNVDDGPLVCGILDQDRIWRFGEGLDSGVWGPGAQEVTIDIFRNPDVRRYKLRSMRETTYTPRAHMLMSDGYCPWPNADFLMMKMLEHRGWISYNTKLKKFVSSRMDVELVKDYFPLLDDPSSINPRFDIPDHLRHLVPEPPTRDIPDGGQTLNLIPWMENMGIMPDVERVRIAA